MSGNQPTRQNPAQYSRRYGVFGRFGLRESGHPQYSACASFVPMFGGVHADLSATKNPDQNGLC